MDKKRREPVGIQAIEKDGFRYEAALSGQPFGYDQDGGLLIVRDAKNARLVWTQRIYDVDEVNTIEQDKQENFISALELSHDGKQILISDERGRRFELNLTDRGVKQIH